jgi:hypothetical protein
MQQSDNVLWTSYNVTALLHSVDDMFNSSSRNSSYQKKCIFIGNKVRVLVKTRFPDSKDADSKFRAVLLTTRYQRNYVENVRSLGAKAAEK